MVWGVFDVPAFSVLWPGSGDSDRVDSEFFESGINGDVAATTVGGDRSGWAAGPLFYPSNGGSETESVGRVPYLDLPVDDDTVAVVGDLGGVTELGGPSRLPLRIGRASGSCNDTSRSAPAGMFPARRCAVWLITRCTRSIVVSRSSTIRCSLPSPGRLASDRGHWPPLL